MNKSNLNALVYNKAECLTRSQMKNVFGGNSISRGICDDECAKTKPCAPGFKCTAVDERETCGRNVLRCFEAG